MTMPKSEDQAAGTNLGSNPEGHRTSGYPDPYTYSSKAKGPVYNPPVELPSSSASNFFEEATTGESEESEARRRFNKFCSRTQPADGSEPKHYLTYENFVALLAHYEAAPSAAVPSYFYALDRKRDDVIDFDEFFMGVVAGDPTTVHILNSFTGRERSQFTFDFYDKNHSGLLEIEEFEQVVKDCALAHWEGKWCREAARDKAEELGLLDQSREDASFMAPDKHKFYDFIMSERLRGTSRLFRFTKSLIRPPLRQQRRGTPNANDKVESLPPPPQRSERAQSERGGERQQPECFELPEAGKEALIPDLTTEEPSSEQDSEMSPYILGLESDVPSLGEAKDVPPPPPYDAFLLPAPPSQIALDPDLGIADAVDVARRVVETLRVEDFPGLVPPPDGSFTLLTSLELIGLCNAVRPILKEEGMIITHIAEPIKVFGSLHGQLCDLLSWFKWHKPPSDERTGDLLYVNYLFLGDYADRGGNGLEVLTILFSLKVLFPNRIFLLRGHHENRHANYHLGLRHECEKRLDSAGPQVFEYLNQSFEYLSLAAQTRSQFLAIGPGVVPSSLAKLDQLRDYRKPLAVPHPSLAAPGDHLAEQVLLELFTPTTLLSREQGASSVLDSKQIKAFCAAHKLSGILLGREILPLGHLQEDSVIRVCSCLNYCDMPVGNLASILYIMIDTDTSITSIRPKVMTTFLDKHHCLSDYVAPCVRRSSSPSRWPKQTRAPTPDRIMPSQVAARRCEQPEEDQAEVMLFPAYKPFAPKRARPGSTIPDGRRQPQG